MNEMKDRFPRTAGEFADHGRHVMLLCDSCRHRETVDSQFLIFTFGEDFDLYEGYSELQSRLSCSKCCAPRPRIHFYNPNAKNFEPVSYEEALTSSLEFGAFVAARDAGEAKRPYRGNYRKFRR
jgi:hypothetical protein